MKTIKENNEIRELSVACILTDGVSILGCLPWSRTNESNPSYTKSFDLPKGHWEPGETLEETVIREVYEESNFEIFRPEELVDLGRYRFTPNKDLHIFMFSIDFLPQNNDLKCNSQFELPSEGMKPEIVAYKHIDISLIEEYFIPSLSPLILRALDSFINEVEPFQQEADDITETPW